MSVNPKIFNKNYYLNVCLGSEEFRKSKGKKLHPRTKKLIDRLDLKSHMDVLDIGCGRGDATLYIASKVKSAIGIDYSSEAIMLAEKTKRKYSRKIQKKVKFLKTEVTNLNFRKNSFDLVLLIDVFDHLNKVEQAKTLKKIALILKDNGKLYIRTCSNRLLLSYTFRYYTRPMNVFATWLDKRIKGITYEPLPKDPRTNEEKLQHINESDYFTLKKILSKYFKNVRISAETGFLKEGRGIRTKVYNFIVNLYPISIFFPLHILFGHSFSCIAEKPRS